ncbi:MAG: CAP domain-containing protein [Polyangiaceae bacterium]|nr:CAP domain-containing protein [Polyangiaceae bacterium]
MSRHRPDLSRRGYGDPAVLSLVLLTAVCMQTTRCKHAGQRDPSTEADPIGEAEPVERPEGPMDLERAQRYVLGLVNRDRDLEGLRPVEWDEVAARAATRHAEDMVRHGYTGHWGSDGSVPELRYTEAGGVHMDQENAGCFFDGVERELEPHPMIAASEVDKIEAAFMNEMPPNDGHRRNILKPTHNRVGIGLAQPRGLKQVCMAQEFLDAYGEYEPLPRSARRRAAISVAGEVSDPVRFGGVGIARTGLPRPMAFEELSAKRTYHVPEPYVLYFPAGYKTPKPVQLRGRHFSVGVSLDDHGSAGLYEVSVWGKHPGSDALVPVSLRTIIVE